MGHRQEPAGQRRASADDICTLRGEDIRRILEREFGQKGTLTTVWAEKGTRPTAPRQTAYGNLRVLTAVCPATGRAKGLVAPRLDAGVVQSFLDGLSATVPAGTHVALVWDGVGYHVAKALVVPANLTVVTLPPYSPELNPVQRLWLHLRQHRWSNRVYPDIEAIEEAAVSGWRSTMESHPFEKKNRFDGRGPPSNRQTDSTRSLRVQRSGAGSSHRATAPGDTFPQRCRTSPGD